jgi:hypothetical protein
MRSITRARIVSAIVCAALAAACGAAEPEPRSPESAGGAAKSAPNADSDKAVQQAPPAQPPPPPPTTPGAREYAQPPPQSAPLDPWLEFQGAQVELNATTSDCAVACKALASIDRATGHVCAMANASDHCTTARETLKSARRKVRAECTVCPQGPSVDPDGPIPSVP